MRLRYEGYLADASFVRSAAGRAVETGTPQDLGRLLQAGRRAARSLTRLDAEEELWQYLEEAGGEGEEPWFEDLEGVSLPASSALLDALGWMPPPPSERLVREAHDAIRPLRGLRLSGRVRRERVRTLRNEIAGLVLDLEHRLAEESGEDGFEADGDVLTPTRTRTRADVVKALARKLERGVNVLAAVVTLSGAHPGNAGGEDPLPPAVVEQVERTPRALRELWLDVLDGGSFLDQLDDEAVESLSQLRGQGDDDPDLALWLAILDGDDTAIYQALARGAHPDRALSSVLGPRRRGGG